MTHKDAPDELFTLGFQAACALEGIVLDITLEDEIRAALAAVLPAHEAMVRAKVAAEIERIEERDGDGSSWGNGMACAADIARGERT